MSIYLAVARCLLDPERLFSFLENLLKFTLASIRFVGTIFSIIYRLLCIQDCVRLVLYPRNGENIKVSDSKIAQNVTIRTKFTPIKTTLLGLIQPRGTLSFIENRTFVNNAQMRVFGHFCSTFFPNNPLSTKKKSQKKTSF